MSNIFAWESSLLLDEEKLSEQVAGSGPRGVPTLRAAGRKFTGEWPGGGRKTCHHRCFALIHGQPYLMPKPAFSLSWPEAHATAWTVSLKIVIFYPRAVLLIKENFCIMRDSHCIEVLLSGNEFSISHELSQLLMLICVCDLPKLFLFTMLLWNI